jgi:peptidoglycan/LPS O-acetylase OafA/YrhL
MKRYRAEIDGLRALAILPVLLFHAQFPGFTGGYVGVDVFFVISGFLITSILVDDMERGRYSLAKFYERRVRRIMPTLLVVLLFVLAVAPFSMLPSEFSQLWKQTMGALLFVGNIVFWMDAGYFSSDSGTKPLLHAWSLGIEEQFYIFAPIIFWLVLRYARSYLTAVIAAGLILSFVGCVVLTRMGSSAAFYLVPPRAWELLAGSLVAVILRERNGPSSFSVWPEELLAMAGLVLVVLPVFLYTKATSFPGYAAAAPVLGSALVIGFAERTRVGRVLSSRPLVGVGLISYSLYLWHWPLVVFFRNAGWLDAFPGRIAVVVLSSGLAWLSWWFVEQNTRDRVRFPNKRLLLAVSLGALVVGATALVYRSLKGWPSRLPARAVAIDNARRDFSSSRAACHMSSGIRRPEEFCTLGSGRLHVAVWGDSHGVELAKALSEQGMAVTSITYSACRPGIVDYSIRGRPDCDRQNRITARYLSSAGDLDAVVLVADYEDDLSRLDDLVSVARELKSKGRHVIIVGPTPTLPGQSDLPTYLARGGQPQVPYSDIPADIFRERAGSSAEVVLPEELFCRRGSCDLLFAGKPLLFDGHHPSMSSSRITARALVTCIREGECR